jgi:hypothetical protein
MGSLSSMSDRHEGEFPSVVSKTGFWNEYSATNTLSQHINSSSSFRDHLFISCWTARRDEYEGFWRSFTDLKNGIAFKTNVDLLFREITVTNLKINGHILKLNHVKYVNFERFSNYSSWRDMNFVDNHGPGNKCESTYNDGRLAFGNKYFPAQIKRHTFFHEREIRVIGLNETHSGPRIEFDFDWSKVIQEIYFSPHMDNSLVTKFELEFSNYATCPIKKSRVYQL